MWGLRAPSLRDGVSTCDGLGTWSGWSCRLVVAEAVLLYRYACGSLG